MKRIVSLILMLCVLSNVAFAECDFKTGISPLSDGSFKYSEECHRKVGQIVQENKTKDAQIADLSQALTLKDLAIKKADDRAQLWMDTSLKLESNLSKIDELRSKNEVIYFALGVVFTGAAVWGASQLVRK